MTSPLDTAMAKARAKAGRGKSSAPAGAPFSGVGSATSFLKSLNVGDWGGTLMRTISWGLGFGLVSLALQSALQHEANPLRFLQGYALIWVCAFAPLFLTEYCRFPSPRFTARYLFGILCVPLAQEIATLFHAEPVLTVLGVLVFVLLAFFGRG